MEAAGARASNLINLCMKHGDFKVALAYKKEDQFIWSKHQTVLKLWETQKGMEFLERANNRQILPCEIVLDMDDDVSEKKLKEICDALDEYGFSYKAYFTGSKGYHIHVYIKELAGYSKQSRYKIRHHLISEFGCDTQKSSDTVMIALEDVPHCI